MKQATINELNRLENWFKSHDEVGSADCQVMYYPEGTSEGLRRTTLLSYITFIYGKTWNHTVELRDGDFRDGIEISMAPHTKKAFERYLLDPTVGN